MPDPRMSPTTDDPDDLDLPDNWQIDLTPPQWHRDVVEVLQGALDRAKRGEITNVAVASVLRSGGIGTAFAGGGRRFQLVAGTTYLLHRLVEEA